MTAALAGGVPTMGIGLSFGVTAVTTALQRRSVQRARRRIPGHSRTAGVRVRPYYTRAGAYVRPHYRRSDSTPAAEPSWPEVIATSIPLLRERRALGIPARGRSRRPGRPVRGLVSAAAFLVPATDRTRYAQEYRSELWDLAQAGAGSLRQLLYALRQLRRAIPMGLALRSPRRRSAAP